MAGRFVGTKPAAGTTVIALAEFTELALDAAAGGPNTGRLYTRDNGAGKTQLVVRFSSGAVQVLATQP